MTADSHAVRRYRGLVRRHRWITLAATLGALALGVVGMGKVEQQFFPDSNRPNCWWTCGCRKARPSTSQRGAGEARGTEADDAARRRRITTFVGQGVPRFYLPLDQIFPQNNVSQLILVPPSLEARERIRKPCRNTCNRNSRKRGPACACCRTARPCRTR
jgi:multidrug efflux pump